MDSYYDSDDYATCHDVGISGNCGLDCPVLRRGDCDYIEDSDFENSDLDEEDKAEIREAYGLEAPVREPSMLDLIIMQYLLGNI